MIHLNYNSTKDLAFYLQPSISNPVYLLSLVNYTTRERKSFIAPDTSTTSEMLQLTVTEVGAGAESILTGDISIKTFGRYTLEVYEQVSSTNLDVTIATFLGDDELIAHEAQTYDEPPSRNPIVELSVCPLGVSVSVTAETIAGDDGTATANDTNGSGTITYLWNDSLAQTTQTATGLAPGTYLVIVSDDVVAGCTASASGTISAYVPAPTCSISIDSITTTFESYVGAGDGTATAVISGASNIHYEWNTGETVNPVTTLSTGDGSLGVQDLDVDGACIATLPFNIDIRKYWQPDGVNDWGSHSVVNIGISEDFIIQFGVLPVNTGNYRIMRGGNTTDILFDSDNRLQMRFNGTTKTFNFASSVPLNEFSYIHLIRTSDTLRAYIDGVQFGSSLAISSAWSTLQLGYHAAAFLPHGLTNVGISAGVTATAQNLTDLVANPENFVSIVGGGSDGLFYDMQEEAYSPTASDTYGNSKTLTLQNTISIDHFKPIPAP